MSLTDFLLARIAEDELVARAATPAPWVDRPMGSEGSDVIAGGNTVLTARRPARCREFADATHIARHDPARVLAECEAKRQIMELHPVYRGARIQPVSTDGVDFGCEACHALDRLHSDSLIEALGYCDTLTALAAPYADHPDYNDAWRP